MKSFLLLLSLLACSSASAAEVPRLALWITDPIGLKPVEVCAQPLAPGMELPVTAPSLTDRDVTGWNRDSGRWTFSPASLAGGESRLKDHCFVLAIDGRLVSRGVVLSSHSARLVEFPVISVHDHDHATDLRLTSGNNGLGARRIHVEALDAVLAGSGGR